MRYEGSSPTAVVILPTDYNFRKNTDYASHIPLRSPCNIYQTELCRHKKKYSVYSTSNLFRDQRLIITGNTDSEPQLSKMLFPLKQFHSSHWYIYTTKELYYVFNFNNKILGTCLVVPSLRLHLPMKGVKSLVRERRSHVPLSQKTKI